MSFFNDLRCKIFGHKIIAELSEAQDEIKVKCKWCRIATDHWMEKIINDLMINKKYKAESVSAVVESTETPNAN